MISILVKVRCSSLDFLVNNSTTLTKLFISQLVEQDIVKYYVLTLFFIDFRLKLPNQELSGSLQVASSNEVNRSSYH